MIIRKTCSGFAGLIILSFFTFANYLVAAESIKIAIAGPHTGAYAAFGEQFWKGAEQAVKDLNKNGGVLGKKLIAVKADDACEPKQARNLANRVVDKEQVAAVVGHFCSSSTITASEIYFENNILMMTPASTNPPIPRLAPAPMVSTNDNSSLSTPLESRSLM